MEEILSSQKYIPVLEALLFAHGEAMTLQKICTVLHINEEECNACINALETILYEDKKRGLMLLKNGNMIQLATKPEFQNIYETLVIDELRAELTPAGREVLALVAYCGPLPRSTIDYIRGVNSSFTLRNLLMRGLIERTPDPHRANAFQYTTSMQFLSHIGLATKEALPQYQKYRDILQEFSSHKEDSIETIHTP